MAFLSHLITSSRLSTSILVRILLFSGQFTLAITSLQAYLDYESRIDGATQDAARTVKLFSESIGRSIWELNHPNTNEQAQSLFNAGYFSYIVIELDIEATKSLGKATISLGKSRNTSEEQHVVPLTFSFSGQVFDVGDLVYEVDNQRIKQKVINDLYLILISQFIKTFMVSIFILYILHRTVIRHINEITNWLNAFKSDSRFQPMLSTIDMADDNEMVKLKSQISNMGAMVHQHTVELESIVEQRTAELEEANSALKKLAYTDSLTGVANRTAFFEKADKELRRSRRLSYDLGLIMLDLDHFKSVNDNYGHDAGDEVLKRVTQSMSKCLREEDTLGRLGGEEFAIIVPGADKQGMHKLATRLHESLNLQDFSFLEQNKKITVSIGYTKANTNEPFKAALKRADEHLYTAKESGRNNSVTDKEFVYRVIN